MTDWIKRRIPNISCSEVNLGRMLNSVEPRTLQARMPEADICLADMRLLYVAEGVYFRGQKYELITRSELPPNARDMSARLASPTNYNDAFYLIS